MFFKQNFSHAPYYYMSHATPCISQDPPSLQELASLFSKYEDYIGEYEVRHIIINLYLVMAGGRKAFLFESYHEGLRENPEVRPQIINDLNTLIQQQNLTIVGDDTNGYLIAKGPIDVNRLHDETYLAEMLDFGCIDPNYGDLYAPAYGYHFHANFEGSEDEYLIMDFRCTTPHRVTDEKMNNMITKLKNALPDGWEISATETYDPPLQRRPWFCC